MTPVEPREPSWRLPVAITAILAFAAVVVVPRLFVRQLERWLHSPAGRFEAFYAARRRLEA